MTRIVDLQTHGERYASVAEAAMYFHVGRTTIRKWVEAGVVKAIQPAPGLAIRICVRSLRRLERQQGR